MLNLTLCHEFLAEDVITILRKYHGIELGIEDDQANPTSVDVPGFGRE